MKNLPVRRVPGTPRQSLTAADGTTVQRSYVYLPAHVWSLLHEMARTSGTSVSQVIQSFATAGTANSKEFDVYPSSTASNTN